MAEVKVAASGIHGIGVFATHDFAEGETVLVMDSRPLVRAAEDFASHGAAGFAVVRCKSSVKK